MASEVLMTISRDEVERARLMSEFKYQVDMRTHIAYAKQEGIREGIQEGIREGAREIARKMKARGRPFNEITEDTGLTGDQIKAL